ncbi:hypothetical protein BH11PLA1_BH11PLA1_23010 [soil metagenome]
MTPAAPPLQLKSSPRRAAPSPRLFRLLALTLAAAPLATLAACGTTATVDVASADLVKASPDADVITFTLRATTQDDTALPLSRAIYTATLGPQSVTVERSPEATLRPMGAQIITLPAAFPHAPPETTPGASRTYTITGKLLYKPSSAVLKQLYELGLYRPSIPFSATGTLE